MEYKYTNTESIIEDVTTLQYKVISYAGEMNNLPIWKMHTIKNLLSTIIEYVDSAIAEK